MASRSVQGHLLVVEGPDGVGKTTVCQALKSQLLSTGHDLLSQSFPGTDPGTLGELVYRVHHDEGSVRADDISVLAKQALHIAAHIDAIDRQIVPALREGKTVLLDRFWWSTWVYGLCSGCDRLKLHALVEAELAAWGEVRPTLAVLLWRSSPINREDPLPYWRSLADEYQLLAERERQRYPVEVIENSTQVDVAINAILGMFDVNIQRHPRKYFASEDAKPIGRRKSTEIVSHIAPLQPSVVYDSYWRFAAERQKIFFKRLEGRPAPWTEDTVLAEYKFTNAYRASDRVSQYLIRNVIYRDDLPATAEEVFFRILIFKLFNKIETWEALETELGLLTLEGYTFERYDQVLTRAMAAGNSIYSAAYIMPSGGSGHKRKHQNHLALLELMLADAVPRRLSECSGMQRAFELLKSYAGIGDFLAYQYVTDINYSQLTDFSESDFVVPGPGALDGIEKCFVSRGGLNEPEIIKFMADRQELEFERQGLSFRSLWGRPLQLIDCQNLFCEIGKYARVRHPEIVGSLGRTRIKQRLSPKPSFPEVFYPPKWRLNEAISRWQRERTSTRLESSNRNPKPENAI